MCPAFPDAGWRRGPGAPPGELYGDAAARPVREPWLPSPPSEGRPFGVAGFGRRIHPARGAIRSRGGDRFRSDVYRSGCASPLLPGHYCAAIGHWTYARRHLAAGVGWLRAAGVSLPLDARAPPRPGFRVGMDAQAWPCCGRRRGPTVHHHARLPVPGVLARCSADAATLPPRCAAGCRWGYSCVPSHRGNLPIVVAEPLRLRILVMGARCGLRCCSIPRDTDEGTGL